MNKFAFIAIITIIATLNSSCDDKNIEESIPQEGIASSEESVSSLPLACIQWDSSPSEVKAKMDGYMLTEEQKELLIYKNPNEDNTISYQFQDGLLIATSVMFLSQYPSNYDAMIKNYSYLGEISNTSVYCDQDNNTFAIKYSWNTDNISYKIIGFTPIRSNYYENVEPIMVNATDAVNITSEGTEIGGVIEGYEGNAICGILYSTYSDMSSPTKKTKEASSEFSFSITGLVHSTTYYYQAFAPIDGITYFSDIKSFETAFVQTYAIGDWYPNYNNREGVVFYTSNNGTHGKIVSLDNGYLYWDTETLFAKKRGCTSNTDGLANTGKMPTSSTQTLAGPWCLNHGDGWYCPARNELVTLANNINTVNSTLASGGYPQKGAHCWSSTEYSSDMAYIVTLGIMSSSDYIGKYYTVSKGQGYSVCAIKQF